MEGTVGCFSTSESGWSWKVFVTQNEKIISWKEAMVRGQCLTALHVNRCAMFLHS